MNKEIDSVKLIQQLTKLCSTGDNNDNTFNQTLNCFQSFNKQIETTSIQFDFLIENQRGFKFFGIPIFTEKSLLPIIDPINYQNINGKPVNISLSNIDNYPLPDFQWKWSWNKWYVFMFKDVDPNGWLYNSLVFQDDRRWKGKYYLGNTIRRRIWIKQREREHVNDHVSSHVL
ncbi:unnamed protein product [Candida verbasci]|uniref:Peroxin/Ferlin domain-containing protein n=1 Tax=Candida verbasci TaxID=1227364 RepID=A0A9W4TV75_9ASCO|nr:unnamed protein product [Candida verbasci]